MENNQIPKINLNNINLGNNKIKANIKNKGNTDFKEIVDLISSKKVEQNSVKNNPKVSLEFSSIRPVDEQQKPDQNNQLKINKDPSSLKTNLENTDVNNIFSKFNPQKPVNIKNELNTSQNLNKQSEQINEKMGEKKEEKNINSKENSISHFKEAFSNEEKQVKKFQNEFEDQYIAENSDFNLNEDELDDIERELKYLDDPDKEKDEENKFGNGKEGQKRKRNQKYKLKEKNKSEKDTFEVYRIVESYKLVKPKFQLNNINKESQQYKNWIHQVIKESDKTNFNNYDANKLSNFIANSFEKINLSDKNIFKQSLKKIFLKDISGIYPNIVARMEKKAFQLVYQIFPPENLQGFLKKTYLKAKKDKKINEMAFAVYKLTNGIKVSNIEASLIASSFQSEFKDDQLINLNQIFNGYYNSVNSEKTYKIIEKMYLSNNLPPGFVGCLYEIFFNLMKKKHSESAKNVLKFLKMYANEEVFKYGEAKIIASLISNSFFEIENFDMTHLTNLITDVITNKKVEYFFLELVLQISGKNLLDYLPSRIDLEVKEYLRYLPLVKKETKDLVFKEEFNFLCGGRLKIFHNEKKYNIFSITVFNDELNETDIYLDENNLFLANLKNNFYRIKKININKLGIIEFDNNSLFCFSVDKKIDMFYLGTLNIFLDESLSLIKVQLKNQLNYFKKKKDKLIKNYKIKVNPKLF